MRDRSSGDGEGGRDGGVVILSVARLASITLPTPAASQDLMDNTLCAYWWCNLEPRNESGTSLITGTAQIGFNHIIVSSILRFLLARLFTVNRLNLSLS